MFVHLVSRLLHLWIPILNAFFVVIFSVVVCVTVLNLAIFARISLLPFEAVRGGSHKDIMKLPCKVPYFSANFGYFICERGLKEQNEGQF